MFCVSSGVVLQCSAMFHESGYGDTAGQVLTKAAKYVSYTCPMGMFSNIIFEKKKCTVKFSPEGRTGLCDALIIEIGEFSVITVK